MEIHEIGKWTCRPVPVGYFANDAGLDEYPVDRFCADRETTFGYWCVFTGQKECGGKESPKGVGWILVSPGPNGDYDLPGTYDAYDPAAQRRAKRRGDRLPPQRLLIGVNPSGSAFTYDATNGLVSDGDIWRIFQ